MPIINKKRLKSSVLSLDERLAVFFLSLGGERDVLLSFLFHVVFASSQERDAGIVDPQQGLTVEMFRAFVRYFREQSYRFVTPSDILGGLPPGGRYVLITFDDGYYNHCRALPVMEEFDVPAVFFISSGHVKCRKAFWWDVVYREMRGRGRAEQEIQRAIASYKQCQTSEIESRVRTEFGEHALEPVSDLDRPFCSGELAEFASHRLAHLGNHTRDHAILTNYSRREIREQIEGAQSDIQAMTGRTPRIIAYPNGNDSREVVEAACQAGSQLGMLARPGRNCLTPLLGGNRAMRLKRFTLSGMRDIERQCLASRAPIALSRLLIGLKKWPRIAPLQGRSRALDLSAAPTFDPRSEERSEQECEAVRND